MKSPILLYLIFTCITGAISQTPAYRLFTMQDGLSQMKITCLHQDTRGYIWIGTRNGLNKFNGKEFEVFTTDDGLPHNRIHQIDQLQDGRLVILSYDGLSIYDGASFKNYNRPFLNVVYQLAVDQEDKIWINDSREALLFLFFDSTYQEFFKMNEMPHSFLQQDQPSQKKFLFTKTSLFEITSDSVQLIRKGNFLIFGHQFGSLDNRSLFIQRITGNIEGRSIVGDSIITSFVINENLEGYNLSENKYWLSKASTLSLPGTFNDIRLRIENEFLFVNDVIEDNFGQIWIGAENGLGQLYNPSIQNFPYSELPYIWSIVEDENNNIWFASFGHGLFKMDTKGIIQKFPKTTSYTEHFFAGSVMDNENRLYFANMNGLISYDGKRFVNKLNKTIFNVLYNKQRNQLVAASYKGVYLSKDNDKLEFVGIDEGIHHNDYIQALGQDHDGNYWFGSYNGVSKLDPESRAVKNYDLFPKKEVNKGIFCFYLDQDEELWMGSDLGLIHFNALKDSLELVESIVLNQIVKSIISFDEDHLLIGAKDGLYIFNATEYLSSGEKKFHVLNRSNGYQGIEPGFTGFFRDSGGYIWMTSASSVDRLDPSGIRLENQSLKTYILAVNENRIPFSHSDLVIQNPFDQSNISITIDASGLVRPTKTLYQYRLNTDDWSQWQESNKIVLLDLKQGQYKMEVRAGPTDVYEVHNSDFIKFKIDLPFYRAKWFPGLAISITIGLFIIAFYNFYRQRSMAKRYQAQIEEVGFLRNQLLLSELNPHFVFNVLAAIQNKIITGQKELASQYIVKLSKLIRNFLEVSYKGNYLNTNTPEFEISLSKEIELLSSFIEFEHIKSDQHFSYKIENNIILPAESIFLPPMLLQPFVENAIKHGLLPRDEGGLLLLKFDYIDHRLICRIEDDGIGLKKAREMAKNRFVTRKSLGSRIIGERIRILNDLGYQVSFSIKDRNPQGTIVEIQIKDED